MQNAVLEFLENQGDSEYLYTNINFYHQFLNLFFNTFMIHNIHYFISTKFLHLSKPLAIFYFTKPQNTKYYYIKIYYPHFQLFNPQNSTNILTLFCRI